MIKTWKATAWCTTKRMRIKHFIRLFTKYPEMINYIFSTKFGHFLFIVAFAMLLITPMMVFTTIDMTVSIVTMVVFAIFFVVTDKNKRYF